MREFQHYQCETTRRLLLNSRFAHRYMHTKCERVKSIHENETKRRNEFVSSELKRSNQKIRDRKEKFHNAKKMFVDNFKAKQIEFEDRCKNGKIT